LNLCLISNTSSSPSNSLIADWRKLTPSQPAVWRSILRKNFTDWKKLATYLELDEIQQLAILPKSAFPLNLPMRLAQKIEKGTLNDPILRQFLPTIQETELTPDFVTDPVDDQAFRRETKLLHKYEGRVLLVCTSACAMHCRYCFRQNFDYDVSNKVFEKEIALIAEDRSIHEVILSGGDPLSLSNETLGTLFDALAQIPHLKRLRIHTRFPIGIPERIDAGFLALFEKSPLQCFLVIHVNHVNELDDEILAHLKALQKKGVVILNQSVLLKGVNDEGKTLKTLCEKLVDNGILPYYLHQLDKVQGAGHFEVLEEQGTFLIAEIAKTLPGYAVPKYVREIPGKESKTAIF